MSSKNRESSAVKRYISGIIITDKMESKYKRFAKTVQIARWPNPISVHSPLWKQRSGVDNDNHAFDTYGYNMAVLEIFADAYCRDALGLPGLSWAHFWQAAKEGVFIEP